jgi:hypothetical protein
MACLILIPVFTTPWGLWHYPCFSLVCISCTKLRIKYFGPYLSPYCVICRAGWLCVCLTWKITRLINIWSQHFGINRLKWHTDFFDEENEAITKANTIFGFNRIIWQCQKILTTAREKKSLWTGNILLLAVITFADWKKTISQSGQELEIKTIFMYFLAEIISDVFLSN